MHYPLPKRLWYIPAKKTKVCSTYDRSVRNIILSVRYKNIWSARVEDSVLPWQSWEQVLFRTKTCNKWKNKKILFSYAYGDKNPVGQAIKSSIKPLWHLITWPTRFISPSSSKNCILFVNSFKMVDWKILDVFSDTYQ